MIEKEGNLLINERPKEEKFVDEKLRYFYITTIGQNNNYSLAVNSFDLKSVSYPSYDKLIEVSENLHPGQTKIQVIGITEMSPEDFKIFSDSKIKYNENQKKSELDLIAEQLNPDIPEDLTFDNLMKTKLKDYEKEPSTCLKPADSPILKSEEDKSESELLKEFGNSPKQSLPDQFFTDLFRANGHSNVLKTEPCTEESKSESEALENLWNADTEKSEMIILKGEPYPNNQKFIP